MTPETLDQARLEIGSCRALRRFGEAGVESEADDEVSACCARQRRVKMNVVDLGARHAPKNLFEASDKYLQAKEATVNTARVVEFERERLEVAKRYLGHVRLSSIRRETIAGFQAKRRVDGASNRTVNMDVGVLRRVLKRSKHWHRLEDASKCSRNQAAHRSDVCLRWRNRNVCFEVAESNPQWTHVYCAAVLAANTSMRGVEIKHLRRKDMDLETKAVHIRKSKNEGSKRVLPLNDDALAAVKRMIERADELGHTKPEHYLWCDTQHNTTGTVTASY
jgi:integrase